MTQSGSRRKYPPPPTGIFIPRRRSVAGGNSRIVCVLPCARKGAGCLVYAVAIMSDRINRRVIKQPCLDEDVDRPRCLADDAEGRRTIARDWLAGNLLQLVLTSTQVFQERRWGEAMHPFMVPSVAGNFVTGTMDFPNQPRLSRDIADHEERSLNSMFFESFQQVVGRRP